MPIPHQHSVQPKKDRKEVRQLVLADHLLELISYQAQTLLLEEEILHRIDLMAQGEPKELIQVDQEICCQQNMEQEELTRAKVKYRSMIMTDKQTDQQQRRQKWRMLA